MCIIKLIVYYRFKMKFISLTFMILFINKFIAWWDVTELMFCIKGYQRMDHSRCIIEVSIKRWIFNRQKNSITAVIITLNFGLIWSTKAQKTLRVCNIKRIFIRKTGIHDIKLIINNKTFIHKPSRPDVKLIK